MRRFLLLLPLLAFGACASTVRWEKQGADLATIEHDSQECRVAAQREAFRYSTPPFPYWYGFGYGAPSAWFGRGYSFSRLSWETDRLFAESRLAAFCMRSRGYELVRVEEPKG
ncbi:MAG: hypothetical protein KIT25_12395 [Enhydrobacter sp.]|nr:MAG: hypothetical protein KIT25_12395 [Enhydrobacter sp.]